MLCDKPSSDIVTLSSSDCTIYWGLSKYLMKRESRPEQIFRIKCFFSQSYIRDLCCFVFINVQVGRRTRVVNAISALPLNFLTSELSLVGPGYSAWIGVVTTPS